jgi:hypothetical protein
MNRLADIKAFYGILAALEVKLGGKRILSECTGRMNWPNRGVYFFFEPGEMRRDSGAPPGVVRVGTHATTADSTKACGKLGVASSALRQREHVLESAVSIRAMPFLWLKSMTRRIQNRSRVD